MELNQQKEAKIGLDMIDSGRWAPTVRRPTDSGDFIDTATDQKWDIKGYHSDWPDHLVDKKQGVPFPQAITRERFEADMREMLVGNDIQILLDIRKVDSDALAFMRDVVEQGGWSGRVEWHP